MGRILWCFYGNLPQVGNESLQRRSNHFKVRSWLQYLANSESLANCCPEKNMEGQGWAICNKRLWDVFLCESDWLRRYTCSELSNISWKDQIIWNKYLKLEQSCGNAISVIEQYLPVQTNTQPQCFDLIYAKTVFFSFQERHLTCTQERQCQITGHKLFSTTRRILVSGSLIVP